MTRRLAILLGYLLQLGAQTRREEQPDMRLPSGKSQRQEILKQEHQKSLEDLSKLIATAEDLKSEMEKNDYHVLSLEALKKIEDIEKLARRIRSRMRR
ncbi:MAG: hypothetical protein HYS04_16230 [Acidobacteria bacterium]|nr:hypothetical protein [Acidobacteriota bacterium]